MENQTVTNYGMTLDELNKGEVLRQVPLIICLILFAVCGTIGNILVLYVYKTKYGASSCRTFVLFLSAVDLISALVGIPIEIGVLLQEFDFRFGSVCKLSVFLNSWPTLTSGFVLLSIAIDRYRKICKPFQWQINPRSACYFCLGCVLVALAFSLISPLIYGIKHTEHAQYNLTVSECAVTIEMQATLLPLINNVCFAVLFVGALVAMCTMYVFIGIEIKAFARRRAALKSDYLNVRLDTFDRSIFQDSQSGSHETPPRVKPDTLDIKDTGSDVIFCSESTDSKRNDSDVNESPAETSLNKPTRSNTNTELNVKKRPKSEATALSHSTRTARKSWFSKTLHSIGRHNGGDFALTKSLSAPPTGRIYLNANKKQKENSNRQRAQRTAAIMLRVTLAFIISYFPLLCILLIRTTVSGFTESLSDTERAVYKFFLRSYYLNCTINPIIYGMWDTRFRKTIKQFCHRMC